MIDVNLTPEQLKALGLDGEPATITPESFSTALDAILSGGLLRKEHGQQLTTLTAERDAAVAKLQEIEDAKSMGEVEALLAEYDMPEESAAAFKELALANRDQAKRLLGGMKKKEPKVEETGERKAEAGEKAAEKTEAKAEEPKAEEKKEPPKPVHDPKAEPTDAASEAERLAEADKLIAELRKEGRFPDYTAAREEIRRRRPELFA